LSEIIREAFKRNGYEADISFLPWKRALAGTKEGKHQALFTIWHRPEREEWFVFSDSLPANELGFFKRTDTAEQIPVDTLVVPLAIIDIRERAENDPDTELRPEDIRAWESRHGELPEGCCVAVDSGWDRYVAGKWFRNADEEGVMHFPGVHVDAVQMLLDERDVVGLAIDAISIDHGPTTDYSIHYKWLPAGRWAVENLANISKLPHLKIATRGCDNCRGQLFNCWFNRRAQQVFRAG
jgi:hypothetical protein